MQSTVTFLRNIGLPRLTQCITQTNRHSINSRSWKTHFPAVGTNEHKKWHTPCACYCSTPIASSSSSSALALRGLGFSSGKSDILEFFADTNLTIGEVAGPTSRNIFFVQFESSEDAKFAQEAKALKYIGNRFIEMNPADNEKVVNARESLSITNTGDFVLELSGMAFESDNKSIEKFLSPLELKRWSIEPHYSDDRKGSGTAYVEFNNETDMKQALREKNREYVDGRYVTMKLFSAFPN